jgi:Tfp pilus assembly protein PilN
VGATDAATEVGSPSETGPRPTPRDEKGDRVSRTLFLLTLLGFLLCAIGVVVQSQRIDGFQAEIVALEGETANLSDALSTANRRVEGFEVQQQRVRRSVQVILDDVLALDALVASELAAAAPLEPEEGPLQGGSGTDSQGL